MSHRGWYSRGYLPHLDAADEIQAVTFRLADALPKSKIQQWQRELSRSAGLQTGGAAEETRALEDQSYRQLRQRIAKYEDAGHGSCILKEPECAQIVEDALLFFDGERYRILEWCIMPNHVHVIFKTVDGYTLDRIVKSWKAYSSKRINERLGKTGVLWQREYHDRYIRDLEHLESARAYVRNNPVKAGLCEKPGNWAWSSAGFFGDGDAESPV